MNANHMRIAYHYYKKWKERAFAESDEKKRLDAMKRAFFWGEIMTGFAFIKSLEEASKTNSVAKKAVVRAKLAISRKLKDYSEDLLREMGYF